MLARTERRLGFVAAIILTTAAFTTPSLPVLVAQNDTAATHHASVTTAKPELRRVAALHEAVLTPAHFK
ncbi:hypothetical protein DKP76_02280 [Falsochrobactrum shanghaiense]|uniref:Uncharacterized protein n=1 Tax=Falsochrobactrum shanghaiense TaxID=2201899 RepID=A0A316JBM2_9HYPH|nr:hypothetical protein [Falsochrobactrum shanghaiense]PWL19397.1 hypothetical protein DKP76_02280 [Falsochrobactrum shanghaiense]